MTAANYDNCFNVIIKNEGGFTNNPRDSGGPTNLGVTQKTLSNWLGRQALVAEVQALTESDVSPIYKAYYWNAARCDYLPNGVDLMVFDEAINEGPGTAVRHLQEAVGVTADGLVGPNTLQAATRLPAAETIDKVAAIRAAYYRDLPDFDEFGDGWEARDRRTAIIAHSMVAPTDQPT